MNGKPHPDDDMQHTWNYAAALCKVRANVLATIGK